MFFPGANLGTVLFDFDGTLVDSESIHTKIWTDILGKFGQSAELREADIVGLPASHIARTLFSDEEVAKKAEALFEEEELKGNYQWMNGVGEFVDFLYDQGFQLAIATNSRREKVQNFLKKEGYLSFFSFIASCEDVEHRKPHPDIYQYAMAKSGMPAERIIAVEDSETGMKAASVAGLRCLHVQPGKDYTVDTWKKMLGAKAMLQEQREMDAVASVLWEFHKIREPLEACDVIVGLGSYDPIVAEECADLLQKGLGKKIIFSGKEGNWTAGKSSLTEAEEFGRIAEGKGIPTDKIVLEKAATNIGQNIAFSRKIMDEYNWKSAIFVTKPQTTRRTRLTINKQAHQGISIVSSPDYTMEAFLGKFGRKQLFNEMVGDIDRIIKYPGLGFQEAVAVPEKVMEAFESLKRAGFIEHLMK